MLPIGTLLSCIAAYIPQEVMLHNTKIDENFNPVDSTWSSNGLFNLILHLYSKITTNFSNPLNGMLIEGPHQLIIIEKILI